MSSKVTKFMISAALAATVTVIGAAATDVEVGTVTGDVLRLRSEPSTSAEIVGYAYEGEKVAVLEAADGWYSVYYDGLSGYMSAEFLSVAAVDNIDLGTAYIDGTTVRMRAQPNTDSSIMAVYNTGDELKVIGINNGWYKVVTTAGTGYVKGDYVRLGSGSTDSASDVDSASSTTVSSTAEAVVEYAKQFLGVPYVYGGTSSAGFDCSGLIYYVYREFGITLERVACNQYYSNGTYVEKSDLAVGDLVFFSSSSSSIGHVGMYIGDGQFIHASSGSSYCVTISSLSESYYTARYVGAKRIL